MASGIYGRVQARGFPVPAAFSDDAEAVAQAALEAQGGWADPAHGDISWGQSPSTLTGFDPEGPGPIGAEVLGDRPGPGEARDPNQAPGYGPGTLRTHAAPWPGWAGSYHDHEALQVLHQNSREIHAADFGGPKLQDFGPGQSPGGTVLPMDPSGTEDYGDSNQAPLTGAQRVLGGRDAVQGYGGGGSGPGGVDGYGYAAVRANRLGVTGNVVNAYLDPAERPFKVAQASGSYIPTDAVTGPEPFASFIAADGNAYHDPTSYSAPTDPSTLQQPLAEATAWGW
jgi:hypothetical protein